MHERQQDPGAHCASRAKQPLAAMQIIAPMTCARVSVQMIE